MPGLYGYEAGQTGVGDIFAWFVDHAVPPRYHDEARARGLDLHAHLSELAARQEVGAHGLIALDWNNGNRSVLVDHELSGLIVGLTLATRAEDIYRALIEATAFGTRMILDAFADAGMPRGRARRRRRAGQEPGRDADLRRRDPDAAARRSAPTRARRSARRCTPRSRPALHPDIRAAAAAMGRLVRDAYVPDARAADAYDLLYERYERLHDHFGRGGDDVMHALRDLRPREVAHG